MRVFALVPPSSIAPSLNHSITQSLNHSIAQSLNHSITQSLNHSITQSLNHSITQSLNHSGGDLEETWRRLGGVPAHIMGPQDHSSLHIKFTCISRSTRIEPGGPEDVRMDLDLPSLTISYQRLPSLTITYHHLPSLTNAYHLLPTLTIAYHLLPTLTIAYHLLPTPNPSAHPPIAHMRTLST